MKHFYFKFTKTTIMKSILGLVLLFGIQGMQAAEITSAQSGNWTDTTTWVGGVVPVAADYVIIASGHNLTFALSAATTLGSLNIQSGASLTVSGNFTFTVGSVSPFTNIAGNLNITGTSSRTFGNLTVASTGSINSTGGATSIASTTSLPWVNDGTVTLTTLGLATGKTIENNGTFTCAMGSTSAGTFNNNSGATLTLSGTIAGNINNFGTMNSTGLSGTAATAIINNKASGVINFTGGSMSATNLVLNATEAGNTVNYSAGVSQTLKNVQYSNIILSNAGTKTIPTVASATLCTGTLSIEGTAKASITNTNVGVAKLDLGGVAQLANTYGGASSTAAVKNSTYFTGVGFINVQATLGVAQFSANDLKLYPNPATGGNFTISLPFMQEEAKVSILNVAGQTIYSTTIAAGENFVSNPNKALAAGVYFVKIEQDGQSVTKKLIVN